MAEPAGVVGLEPRLVDLDEVRAAAERIEGVVRRTPLLRRELTPDPSSPAVWLKCESLQHVGAFKARGAYHFVSRLSPEERSRGLISYSSGNHAQAVAFAARAYGIEATIVMPVDAPRVKLEGTLGLGARVEQIGTTSAERRARAEEILIERGGVMVPPFDHPDIIAGQGTTGLEILEQLRSASVTGEREPEVILVPIGGGGLVSGVAASLTRLVPSVRIIGVEPEGAAAMRDSLEAGRPVTLDRVDTVADGLKPVRPGDWTFLHARELVHRVVTVSDRQIREAVLWTFGQRLVVEPSGAAAVAALRSGVMAPGQRGATVAVLSGGNIDPPTLAGWLAD